MICHCLDPGAVVGIMLIVLAVGALLIAVFKS